MTNKELQQHVKTIANSKGYSLTQLLKNCGINTSYFSDLVNKDIKPSVQKFKKISEFLEVPLDILLYGESDRTDSEIDKLIETYEKLDHKGKIRVQNTAYDELERVEHETFVQNPAVSGVKRAPSSPVPNSAHRSGPIKQKGPEQKQA